MPTNIGSMGNKNKRTNTNSKRPTNEMKESAKTLSRKEKERKLLEELGSEQPGMNKRKKIAIGATAGVLGVAAVLVPTVKYFIDNQKHIITMKVQGTHYETYKLEVKKGSLIKELKTYTITGYTFVGFFKDEACTIPYTDGERVTKNSTVYCKYAPTTYTITYPTNQEGYIVNAEPEIEYGNKFIFTVNILEDYNKSNYIVKVNGEIIESNEYGQYIIDFVETNINITVENVVKNKVVVNFNLGSKTLEIEAEEDAAIQDVLEENETLIKEQVISETLKNNPNSYTQEQLANLTLTELLDETTAGIYLDTNYTKEVDLNQPISEIGETINVNAAYATLDKLIIENNSVKAKDKTISGEVVIPKSVTSIGYRAFHNCIGLTEITIPNSVTSIDGSAFYQCTGLTEINIPNSVTSIGYATFSGCTSLTSILIPDSVTSIGDSAFFGCDGLTSILIPDSVTIIKRSAFSFCKSLAEVTIGNSVTSIGTQAFYNCTGLTSITIGNSVTSIGDNAFSGCSGLTEITIPDSVTSIGIYAFHNCTGLTSVTIGNGVTSIASGAFYNCTSLTSISIPDSVTIIKGSAFSFCKSLAEVTIGNSVTSIGTQAFYDCFGLTNIEVDIDNQYYYSSGNCLIEKSTEILILGCKTSEIPNSVTSIGLYAFQHCTGLTEINIPNSVTNIGNNAFQYCTSLTDVYFLDTESSWKAGSTIISAAELQDSKMAATLLMEYANSGLTKVIE